jgi:hypothetical protein
VGGNDTDDDPQVPALATYNEAEGSGAVNLPSQPQQVTKPSCHSEHVHHQATQMGTPKRLICNRQRDGGQRRHETPLAAIGGDCGLLSPLGRLSGDFTRQ